MKESLSTRIARQITGHIRETGLAGGHHLVAQELADLFKVSRAPVTAALKQLATAGIVTFHPNRGFFVADDAAVLSATPAQPGDEAPEDQLYFSIAEDWLSGRLPARVSENELIRLYGATRIRLQVLLGQIAEEGWVARLPGHGWEFQPIISSTGDYEAIYRFRASIEAEALRQPGYLPDPGALQAARQQQHDLLDGQMMTLPRDRLFQINSHFHELIVAWSGNSFFLDAIRRVNRMRRLIEYRAIVDRGRVGQQCRDHLALLDMIERGDNEAAARFAHDHIAGAWLAKKSLPPADDN
jgi:DNA-binding GntR family transcriptional regulator